MITAILVVVLVSRAIFCKKHKKKFFDFSNTNYRAIFVTCIFMLFIFVVGVGMCYCACAMAPTELKEREVEKQTLEEQIERLQNGMANKESVTLSELQEYSSQYNILQNKLSECEDAIKHCNYMMTDGLRKAKFLLYFGS